MMSMSMNEGSTRVRKTPRRRVTYTVDLADLVKYPKQVLTRFLIDAGHDGDPSKRAYIDAIWRQWEGHQGPRLPEEICDLGAGKMKEFKDNVDAVQIGKNGQRYLREERERRMNRVQKRNSRKRLGDDTSSKKARRSQQGQRETSEAAGNTAQQQDTAAHLPQSLLQLLVMSGMNNGTPPDLQQLLQAGYKATTLSGQQAQLLGLPLASTANSMASQLQQQQSQQQQQQQSQHQQQQRMGGGSAGMVMSAGSSHAPTPKTQQSGDATSAVISSSVVGSSLGLTPLASQQPGATANPTPTQQQQQRVSAGTGDSSSSNSNGAGAAGTDHTLHLARILQSMGSQQQSPSAQDQLRHLFNNPLQTGAPASGIQAQNLAAAASLLAQMQGLMGNSGTTPAPMPAGKESGVSNASASTTNTTTSTSSTNSSQGGDALRQQLMQVQAGLLSRLQAQSQSQSQQQQQQQHPSQQQQQQQQHPSQQQQQQHPFFGDPSQGQQQQQERPQDKRKEGSATSASKARGSSEGLVPPPPPPKPHGFNPPNAIPSFSFTGPSPLRPPDAGAQCMQFLQQAWDSGQLQAPPTPTIGAADTSAQHGEGGEPKSPSKAQGQETSKLPSAFFPEMFSPLKTGNLPNLNLNSPGQFDNFPTPDLSGFHGPFSPLGAVASGTGQITPQKNPRSPGGTDTNPSILLASPQFLIGQPSPLTGYLFSPPSFPFSPRRFSLDETSAAGMAAPSSSSTRPGPSSSTAAVTEQQQQQQRQRHGSTGSSTSAGGSGRRARTKKGRNLTMPGSSLATTRVDDTDLLASTETVIRNDGKDDDKHDSGAGLGAQPTKRAKRKGSAATGRKA